MSSQSFILIFLVHVQLPNWLKTSCQFPSDNEHKVGGCTSQMQEHSITVAQVCSSSVSTLKDVIIQDTTKVIS